MEIRCVCPDDVLKDGIEQILLGKGIKSFTSANASQLGSGLTEFYLKEIGQFLYPFTEDYIEEGLCDGSKDCGIDFVFNWEEEWYIFQSKYKGASNSVTHDEISGFFNIHSHVIDESYIEEFGNNRVKDLLYGFKPEHSVQYFFLTNCKLSEKNKADFGIFQEQYGSKFENVTYELKGLSDIKLDYNSALSSNETIAEEVIINIDPQCS